MKPTWYVCQCGQLFRSQYPRILCPDCSDYGRNDRISYRTWGSLIVIASVFAAMLYVFGIPW
jgi:hypothetical protein